MDQIEKIKVYLKLNKEGKTICMCQKDRKKCPQPCEQGVVFRDRYLDWEKTMNGKY